jgi:hypothetical protein
MLVRNRIFLTVLVLVFAVPSLAIAQSVSLTGPLGNQTLQAGDDYFTEVVQNPFDGNERRDIGWEENFDGASVAAVNGLWQGTNATPGGYVFPIFPSLAGTLIADAMPGDRSIPRHGIKYRVDASKYRFLSYRLNHTARSTLAVYWEANDSKPGGYWPDPNSPRGASFDGFYHYAGIPNSGFKLYHFDLANLGGEFEQTQGAWSGNVLALRLDPSVGGGPGAVTQIDWVRLVDPSSAPNITVSWNSSGLNSSSVITVYHDNNNSGFDGTPIERFSFPTLGTDPRSFTFPSAMLPPGDHYFYVEVQSMSSTGAVSSTARTGYSGRVQIQNKPSIVITAPSPSSGDSYATVARGNEWDMDTGGTDLSNLAAGVNQIFRQFITPSFAPSGDAQDAGSVFQAQAEPPYFHIGNAESDVQVHFTVPTNTPIDPSHYRYIVYRMAIGEAGYPTISDKISKGWVSRIVAWNTNLLLDGLSTKAHIVYEGFNTYWFDMAASGVIEGGSPWQSFFRLPNFRLDPGEFNIPGFHTWFLLDYLKLVGENRTPGGFYDIRYTLSDPDSAGMTVSLYYDTDNTGFNGTLITTLTGQGAGDHTYRWNTSGIADGTSLYVYAVVSDGTNTSRAYSTVHVKTGTYTPSAPDPSTGIATWDYDGDGTDDHTVFRPSTGIWYRNQSQAGVFTEKWGDRNFRPVRIDIDGDGRQDPALVVRAGTQYLYYIKPSSSGGLYARYWGTTVFGDQLAVGDYNGDGREEIAVWRPANGCTYILYQDDTTAAACWGLSTDIVVNADYDGDSKTDFAIWRPGDGNWWILNSSGTPYATVQQWGLPGDIPVPGRFGSDSKTKFAVWRPWNGTWYVNDPDSGQVTVQQWGLPGDVPLAGDFNGDGLLGFSIYRQGTWFHNHRNGQIGIVGWGLPGDIRPVKVGPVF